MFVTSTGIQPANQAAFWQCPLVVVSRASGASHTVAISVSAFRSWLRIPLTNVNN